MQVRLGQDSLPKIAIFAVETNGE